MFIDKVRYLWFIVWEIVNCKIIVDENYVKNILCVFINL